LTQNLNNNFVINALKLPKASDANMLKLGIESFNEAPKAENNEQIKDFFTDYTQNEQILAILSAIFGNSPYLTHSILQDLSFFVEILTKNTDEIFKNLSNELKNYNFIEQFNNGTFNKESFYKFLRVQKRKIALLTAIADLNCTWTLEQVTEKLSIFAEDSVQKTCEVLLYEAYTQKIINLKTPETPLGGSGLIIVALGKMGAHELNYSSDIDLAIFYEEDKLEYLGRKSLSQFFIGVAQELNEILSKRTRDGYVFRVDVRLRPDPASNPIAIGLEKAKNYYSTVGQNWERAAFIKCKFIAGDGKSARKFLKFMNEHVYRRELDFETIEDVHSIKRQIDTKNDFKALPKANANPDEAYFGYNVKIGRGGIREIEFYAQTQQLIWGGRRKKLQLKNTCQALNALVEEREISKIAASELTEAYRFLRTLEHRLQMVDDAQTHSLPKTIEDMQKIAIFCGFEDIKSFYSELLKQTSNVRKHYSKLFENAPSLASDLPSAAGSLIFTGTENHPDTINTLEKMGFKNPEFISETIRGWHHGRVPCTIRKQARAELTKLIPSMLGYFAKSYNPDYGFENFHEFLSHLNEDSKIFALLYQNPKLMELMSELMSGYPELASNLARNPELLYYVITPEFDDAEQNYDELKLSLKAEISGIKDFDEMLDITKAWAQDRIFRVGIKLIKQQIETPQVFVALSEIAEIVIHAVRKKIITIVEQNVISKNYTQEGNRKKIGQFAIIAFGKFGNKEMSFGSDLDLVFVYDINDEDSKILEENNISAQQYFTRIANKIVAALSGFTKQGKLYNLDLRLRPNGDAGAMVSSFASMEEYYNPTKPQGTAWAWEYMALTRARAIGNRNLSNRLNQLFCDKLEFKWNDDELKKNVLYIHKKLREVKKTQDIFHVKHVAGGLVDLEYILQFLQLKHANKNPELIKNNKIKGLDTVIVALAEKNIILDEEKQLLIQALKFYQKLQNILRLTSETNITSNVARIVCKLSGFSDLESLKLELEANQNEIKKLFLKYIGG
jgi:glutamate-ammonia-ligase adenylyltransferase